MIKREVVLYAKNHQGHIKAEDGNAICGRFTGDHSAFDVFVSDGVLYEIEYMRGDCIVLKGDHYNICQFCKAKLGFNKKKHEKKMLEYGNRRPMFAPFKIEDEEHVERA